VPEQLSTKDLEELAAIDARLPRGPWAPDMAHYWELRRWDSELSCARGGVIARVETSNARVHAELLARLRNLLPAVLESLAGDDAPANLEAPDAQHPVSPATRRRRTRK